MRTTSPGTSPPAPGPAGFDQRRKPPVEGDERADTPGHDPLLDDRHVDDRGHNQPADDGGDEPTIDPPMVESTTKLVDVSGLSFDSFYRRHRSDIVRAVAVTIGDLDLATEAVDEAMVRAYQRWNTVADLDQPAGWVYRVALNYSRSRLRRVARKLRYTAALPRRDDTRLDVAFADRISDGRVLHAVQALPFDQRAVIVTRVLMCLTEAEAAELLDTKPGTIKSRLSRALATLREQLPEYTSQWQAIADDRSGHTSAPTDLSIHRSSPHPPSHDQEHTS